MINWEFRHLWRGINKSNSTRINWMQRNKTYIFSCRVYLPFCKVNDSRLFSSWMIGLIFMFFKMPWYIQFLGISSFTKCLQDISKLLMWCATFGQKFINNIRKYILKSYFHILRIEQFDTLCKRQILMWHKTDIMFPLSNIP